MGRYFKETAGEQKSMIYIGSCEKFLQALSLNIGPSFQLYHYSPESLSLEPAPAPKRALMQRYALLEKVKDT